MFCRKHMPWSSKKGLWNDICSSPGLVESTVVTFPDLSILSLLLTFRKFKYLVESIVLHDLCF